MDFIRKTIQNEEFFNFSATATVSERSMLLAGLPFAIGGPHAYQQEVVDLACQALTSAQKATEDSVKHFGEEADRVAATITVAEQNLEAARAAQNAANDIEAAKKAALEEEKVNCSNSKVEHSSAEALKLKTLASVAELEFGLEETESALATVAAFQSLDATQVSGAVKVLTVLEKTNAEKTLLVSVTALLLQSSEINPSKPWGAFDDLTFQELRTILEERRAVVAASLAEAQRLAHDASSEELGLNAIHDVSVERVNAASEALKEAKAASVAARQAETAAGKELKRQEQVRSDFLAEQTVAEERLQTLTKVIDTIIELHRVWKEGKDASADKDVDMADPTAVQAPSFLGC